MYEILESYNDINDIKNMSLEELKKFSAEIRTFLIDKVSKNGGHLASNLGVVELTLSLYNVFDFKTDKLIWDVGHQAYVHKILTGRKDKFDTLRQFGGISGFPKRTESEFDIFETGHSSTSISAAVGIARARDLSKDDFKVISVIGDGALTGGMAFEALNDVGYKRTKMIIVLNDNQMSISKNVGGMSLYLSKIRTDPKYNKIKSDLKSVLNKTNIGTGVAKSIEKIKGSIKQMLVPGMYFEDIGIKYLGPIDGHNIKELSKVFNMAKNINGPVIIHVITKKGKGYEFAEKNSNKFHAIGPFDSESGETNSVSLKTYSKAIGAEIVNLAEKDKKVVAITAAMPDGTGLRNFATKFPERFFDVGIAEQHAVTMAAGMASQGYKPVFAVYSTFLQRAYDQVIHDVCMQNLPVIFAIDRAGIVGKDGETHQGVFDLSYLSHMPNITIMSPKCVNELQYMLKWALNQNYPIAIRYPRGGDNVKVSLTEMKNFEKGKWEYIVKEGKIAIIAVGKMVSKAMLVKEKLESIGVKVTIVNACFIKPIDKNMIKDMVENNYTIVTLEDNVLKGGFGTLVLQYVNILNKRTKVLNLAFKDEFIPQGEIETLYKLYGLDVEGIFESVCKLV